MATSCHNPFRSIIGYATVVCIGVFIDFQRKFRERLCRLVHFPELFTVASHEHCDFTGGLGKMQPGSVHFLL